MDTREFANAWVEVGKDAGPKGPSEYLKYGGTYLDVVGQTGSTEARTAGFSVGSRSREKKRAGMRLSCLEFRRGSLRSSGML